MAGVKVKLKNNLEKIEQAERGDDKPSIKGIPDGESSKQGDKGKKSKFKGKGKKHTWGTDRETPETPEKHALHPAEDKESEEGIMEEEEQVTPVFNKEKAVEEAMERIKNKKSKGKSKDKDKKKTLLDAFYDF